MAGFARIVARGVVLLGLLLASGLASGSEPLSLLCDGELLEGVRVISVNESSLVVFHEGAMRQLPLSSLEPELQAKFGYDPAKAERREDSLEEMKLQQVEAERKRLEALRLREQAERRRSVASDKGGLTAAFARFGSAPELKEELDLRPAFAAYSISVRNQGFRPSCSIHAIVGVLEYQFARHDRGTLNFSEDFLIRSTLKTLGQDASRAAWGEEEDLRDAGFALEEVFQAIRAFGLVTEQEGSAMSEVVQSESGLARARFGAHLIPGGKTKVGLGNVNHILNTGTPVVASMSWPANVSLRRVHLLADQPPLEGAGHAVALVGYRCPTGKLEDVTFIFRNSWGQRWGLGGYGFIRYAYLAQNLSRCYAVDLR